MRTNKPLMKYRSSYNNKPSWALAPLDKSFGILMGIYDPESETLALIADADREAFEMLPKVDDTGAPQLVNKMAPAQFDNFKQERMRVRKNYEYYIAHPDDIEWFLETFVENNFKFIAQVPDEPKKPQARIITADQY